MTRKTEATKIMDLGVDSITGARLRFIVDKSGKVTQLGDQVDNNTTTKSSLTGMAKFLQYCAKQNLEMAKYKINNVIFCRVVKGDLVKGSRNNPTLFSAFMELHNLGTLKIGSGIKYQNCSLMYSKDEISDLKTFSTLHIAESFRV